jgi:hypothetical protein
LLLIEISWLSGKLSSQWEANASRLGSLYNSNFDQ